MTTAPRMSGPLRSIIIAVAGVRSLLLLLIAGALAIASGKLASLPLLPGPMPGQ